MIESVTKDLCFRGAFCLRPFSRRVRAPPFLFDCLHKINFYGGLQMKIINLRYYYPTLYTHDVSCAVPDELKELLDQFILEDYRYDAKRRYHRAFAMRTIRAKGASCRLICRVAEAARKAASAHICQLLPWHEQGANSPNRRRERERHSQVHTERPEYAAKRIEFFL